MVISSNLFQSYASFLSIDVEKFYTCLDLNSM